MLQNYNKILILEDKIKNLKLNNLPDNVLLNKNDAYVLTLKQIQFEMSYITTSVSTVVYIPLKQQPYTKLLINWGDNTETSTYIYDEKLVGTDAISNYYLSHIYVAPKMYNILIAGDFKGLNNLSSSILTNNDFSSLTGNYLYHGTLKNDVVISTTTYKSDIADYYLYSINSWGNIPFETLKDFCRNASGLYSIPNTELPNVNDCSNMFLNCINLKYGFNADTNNMKNFALPNNVVNCQNMFKNTNINYDFSNLNFPTYLTTISGMFQGTNIKNINYLFYNQYNSYYKHTPSTNSFLSSFYFKCLPSGFPLTNILNDAEKISGYNNGKLVRILTGQQVK